MSVVELVDEERALALNFAPKACRQALAALWQLDETLGRIVASTTEPMIGQMRLTWWHERLCGLDAGERQAEPLLSKLAQDVLPHDVTGNAMSALVEGWEAVLEPLPLGAAELQLFAERRGGALFDLSARLLGVKDAGLAGRGWALVDFATHCSDPVTTERAVAMAREHFASTRSRLPRPLRILARLAAAKARSASNAANFSNRPLNRFVFLRAVLG